MKKGNKGFETIQAYRRAAGNDQTVVPTIRNYLAYKLRQNYLNSDGTINAARYPAFRRDYDGVFRAVPELAPEFDNAAHAGEALNRFGRFNPQYAPTNVPDLFFAPGALSNVQERMEDIMMIRNPGDPYKAAPHIRDMLRAKLKA